MEGQQAQLFYFLWGPDKMAFGDMEALEIQEYKSRMRDNIDKKA